MQSDFRAIHLDLEDEHWWFRARRRLITSLVTRACPDRNADVLDVGCSSGATLRSLTGLGYTRVQGIDISPEAIATCQQKGGADVTVGDATAMPFASRSFHLLIASDVLEHIDEEEKALREWHRVLRPSGVLLVLVPAFPSLWGPHDAVNQHRRRYRRAELAKRLSSARFALVRLSYWNMCLFPMIAALRLARGRLSPRQGVSDGAMPCGDLHRSSAISNACLQAILAVENAALGLGLHLPFGLSLLAEARTLNDWEGVRELGAGDRHKGAPGHTLASF